MVATSFIVYWTLETQKKIYGYYSSLLIYDGLSFVSELGGAAGLFLCRILIPWSLGLYRLDSYKDTETIWQYIELD